MIVHSHLRKVDRHLFYQVVFCSGLIVQILFIEFQVIKPIAFGMLLFGLPLVVFIALLLLSLLYEFEGFLLLPSCFCPVSNLDAKHLVQEVLEEIKDGGRVDLVAYDLQDFEFLLLYFVHWYLLLSNFLVNGLHAKGVDVLELGGDEHRCDSDTVQA